MGIKASTKRTHYDYFLSIERELTVLSQYVEFDKRNFDVFSTEIARIILAAGAETDVVCRLLCQKQNATSNASSIGRYQTEILAALPNIPAFEVTVPRYGLSLTPWSNWSAGKVPLWWTAYNKTKHARDSHFERANLKNALNAVAGLFVVVLYLYREEANNLAPAPQLMQVGANHTNGRIMRGDQKYNL